MTNLTELTLSGFFLQFRSLSGSTRYYKDHPEQKLRIGREDDMVARAIKDACEEGGIGYDDVLELHHSAALLMLRRSNQPYT